MFVDRKARMMSLESPRPMDRKRYKSHPRRVAAQAAEPRWQLQTLDSEESLFIELEPFLFTADAELCQLARTVAFAERTSGEPLSALLFPPREGVGWLQAYLAEHFDVTVCSATVEPLLEEVSQQCGTYAVFGEPPASLRGNVSLAIECETSWHGPEHLSVRFEELRELLRERGTGACIVPGRLGEDGAVSLCWADGSESDLQDVLRPRFGRRHVPLHAEELPFAHLVSNREDYLTAFLKRHRAFFGRGVRGTCLERMADADFRECLEGVGSHLRCSILLTSQKELEERSM